jgi:hypothetical protein
MNGRHRTIISLLFCSLVLVGASCQASPSTDQYPMPHVGGVAEFQEYPHWQISGQVTVVDERTLRFEHFTFHGDKLTAELRLQKNRHDVATLKDLTNQQYQDATFDLPLPDSVTLRDFNLVTIVSFDIGSPVSGARFK